MSVNLLAPNSAANLTYIAISGNSYTSDVNGIFNSVLPGDISDLINLGATYPNDQSQGKDNLAATTAPVATNDNTQGYAVGSSWINITDDSTYTCADATTNNAVWIQTGSAGVVNVTASTLAVTAAKHSNKTIALNRAAGITATLPAANGSGNKYTFYVGTAVTSNSNIIKTAGSDKINGVAIQSGSAGAITSFYTGANTATTCTLNGSTTGGIVGDLIKVIDIAPLTYSIEVISPITGTAATPFS